MILGMPAKRIVAAAVTATWSPLTKYQSAPTVLSGSNLILTANTGATGTYANAVSSREIQDLGYYSGFLEAASGDSVGFGFVRIPIPPLSGNFPQNSNLYPGNETFSAGLWANSGSVYRAGTSTLTGTGGLSFGVEMAVRVVLNFGTPGTDQWRVWIRRSGGSWFGGGDPVADTSPTISPAIIRAGSAFCVGASVTRSGATSARRVTLHGDAASTTGTVPTGFTAAKWGAELT